MSDLSEVIDMFTLYLEVRISERQEKQVERLQNSEFQLQNSKIIQQPQPQKFNKAASCNPAPPTAIADRKLFISTCVSLCIIKSVAEEILY